MNPGQQINPVNGPYDAIDRQLGGPSNTKEVYSVPYAAVAGSQIVVAVVENTANLSVSGSTDTWVAVEINIVGYVAGYPFRLKRQQVRMLTGPLIYVVPYDQAFDRVAVQVRNVTGGVAYYAPLTGEQINVQCYIQPRGGMNLPGRQ